jgi:hypothetical protein
MTGGFLYHHQSPRWQSHAVNQALSAICRERCGREGANGIHPGVDGRTDRRLDVGLHRRNNNNDLCCSS